jgi:hypothetical protein
VRVTAKPKPNQRPSVELGGVSEKTGYRPKETLALREGRESAEVIVARKPGESREERRTEERKNKAR